MNESGKIILLGPDEIFKCKSEMKQMDQFTKGALFSLLFFLFSFRSSKSSTWLLLLLQGRDGGGCGGEELKVKEKRERNQNQTTDGVKAATTHRRRDE